MNRLDLSEVITEINQKILFPIGPVTSKLRHRKEDLGKMFQILFYKPPLKRGKLTPERAVQDMVRCVSFRTSKKPGKDDEILYKEDNIA